MSAKRAIPNVDGKIYVKTQEKVICHRFLNFYLNFSVCECVSVCVGVVWVWVVVFLCFELTPSRFVQLRCSASACKATGTSRRSCALGLCYLATSVRFQFCAAERGKKKTSVRGDEARSGVPS